MSSSSGDPVRINIFGESHGEAIGVVLDSLSADCSTDEKQLTLQMVHRAPGYDLTSTPRSEGDRVRIVNGLPNDETTGTLLCGMIENTNARSSDHESLRVLSCPGHTDYTRTMRRNGANGVHNGGHFSGRLIIPFTSAGAVHRQILSVHEIRIGVHALRITSVTDTAFNPVEAPGALLERLSTKCFSLIDRSVEAVMRREIEAARKFTDSVGDMVEYAVTRIPVSIGSSMLYGVENVLSSILFSVPTVKDVEFGDGFAVASPHGSENDDAFTAENGQIKTRTDHYGGILGGTTAGMPLTLRMALKPTPSTSQEQNTMNLNTLQSEPLIVHRRHDPYIVPRVIPVVEAAVAMGPINLTAERERL